MARWPGSEKAPCHPPRSTGRATASTCNLSELCAQRARDRAEEARRHRGASQASCAAEGKSKVVYGTGTLLLSDA